MCELPGPGCGHDPSGWLLSAHEKRSGGLWRRLGAPVGGAGHAARLATCQTQAAAGRHRTQPGADPPGQRHQEGAGSSLGASWAGSGRPLRLAAACRESGAAAAGAAVASSFGQASSGRAPAPPALRTAGAKQWACWRFIAAHARYAWRAAPPRACEMRQRSVDERPACAGPTAGSGGVGAAQAWGAPRCTPLGVNTALGRACFCRACCAARQAVAAAQCRRAARHCCRRAVAAASARAAPPAQAHCPAPGASTIISTPRVSLNSAKLR